MPTLSEIRSIIVASSPQDWHAVTYGPTFLQLFGIVAEPNSKWLDHHEHVLRAAYNGDVSLGLAFGLQQGEREVWEGSPFADKMSHNFYIDVLWNGMLIDRTIATSVDGGRIVVPNGTPEVIPGHDNDPFKMETFAETVTAYEANLARVAHVLYGSRDESFDSALTRLKIVVLPEGA